MNISMYQASVPRLVAILALCVVGGALIVWLGAAEHTIEAGVFLDSSRSSG